MGELKMPQKLQNLLQKYKYAAVILLIGLVLMLIPAQNSGTEDLVETVTVEENSAADLESRLEALLSQVSGAGQVKVLLTMETGDETVYQTDTQTDSADTVIVEDADRQEFGLVRRVDAAVYRGAVIACQGADQATVRLAIIEAVSCATGLRSDQISVVKMK